MTYRRQQATQTLTIFNKKMSNGIRIHYLHRDSGNYKKFNYKDFLNIRNLPISDIKTEIERYLIDGMFFYPEKVGIEKFDFHKYCDDFPWYEVEEIETIDDISSEDRIEDFIDTLKTKNH